MRLRQWIGAFCAVVVGAGLGAVVLAGTAQAAVSQQLAIGQATSGDLNVLAVDATTAGSPVKIRRYAVGVGATVSKQRWTFEKITGSGIPAQTYRIRNAGANLCLQRAASSANNAAVTIGACVASNDQYWTVPQSASGIPGRDIRSVRDSRCLDVAGNSTDGNLLVMWQCTSQYPTQKWRVRYGGFDCEERWVTTMCVRPSMPMFGVMSASRQWAVDVKGDADVDFNDFQNFLSFESLSDQITNDVYDVFEMGWSAQYDTGTVSHEVYWAETGLRDGWVVQEKHSLAGLQYGTEALGRSYSFMALPSDTDTKWDFLFNYNYVGTSEFGEGPRVAGGLETGAMARTNELVTLPNAFENHVQLIDGNNVWRRPYFGETSTMQYNTCDDPEFTSGYLEPNTPPWCWTAVTGTRTGAVSGVLEADYFTVGKPGTTTLRTTATPGTIGPSALVNGVDQGKLATCIAAGDNCLTEVPGLAECVAARLQCNAAVKPAGLSAARRATLTAADAAASARRTTGLPATAKVDSAELTAAGYTALTGAGLPGVAGTDVLRVVSGDQQAASRTPGVSPGFVLAYHAASGRLLHSCLGQSCARP